MATGSLGERGARAERRGCRDESGQILLFFVLMLFTLMSFAALVITVGQTLARKNLAQKLADIGAIAGASEQASSLNYITELHRAEFKFLRDTAYVTRVAPFDLLREADSVVQPALAAEQLAVLAPMTVATTAELFAAPGNARSLAEDVTRQNIQSLFPHENVNDFEYKNPEYSLIPTTSTMLFEPTTPHSRTVYWGYYTTCDSWTDCIACQFTRCPTYWAYIGGDLDSYDFITYFTRQFPQKEIHFYWEVTLPETPAMMGMFGKIPKITATAKAKPYGGYTGDPPEEDDIPHVLEYTFLLDNVCLFGQLNNTWDKWYTYKVDKDFSATFKAKLDALTDPQDSIYIVDLKNRFGDQGEVKH